MNYYESHTNAAGVDSSDAALRATLENLERLRSFFGFCQEAGWVKQNPARLLKPARLPDKSTKVKVFTERAGRISNNP